MHVLVAFFSGLTSQDVARANAGLAAIRMQNRVRQQLEVEGYLRDLAQERTAALEDSIDHRAIG